MLVIWPVCVGEMASVCWWDGKCVLVRWQVCISEMASVCVGARRDDKCVLVCEEMESVC